HVGREFRQAVVSIVGPTVFDRDVLALGKTLLFEPLTESTHVVTERLHRLAVEKPDHRHRLLRTGRERPCGGAANKRHERAPLHSVAPSGAGTRLGRLGLAVAPEVSASGG